MLAAPAVTTKSGRMRLERFLRARGYEAEANRGRVAAELRHIDLAAAFSLVRLVRKDAPLKYDRAAVPLLGRERTITIADLYAFADTPRRCRRAVPGRQVRLERFLRSRGDESVAVGWGSGIRATLTFSRCTLALWPISRCKRRFGL